MPAGVFPYGFTSGVEPLDDWLKRHALHNEVEGGFRTFVVCEGRRVVGYYSLAAGSVLPAVTTGRVRRNMPNPVPIVLLGRLAIDRAWQGRGLGGDLLRDAVLRVLSAGENRGARDLARGEGLLRTAWLPAFERRTDEADGDPRGSQPHAQRRSLTQEGRNPCPPLDDTRVERKSGSVMLSTAESILALEIPSSS